ncbi:hypothetical protein COU62_02215 [Candidatus Pacearchaeota archaeon CG10_big_fil_rev_8_21_14_0_10_35_219]|nr:phosphotransferase [Candidatus Pacearchaeota archaeon]OIO41960.1 MAG: hypothetical protein AUJ63_04365 [Candidatus Pacearchaeota archaeon CG1_02_35_32]PIO07784.1 MAG: hypothetical protein COU62_02215 [Candidatus Pacearchaeota archaeon CG10_big_fil_rev_8_21_14_0_10_35_219]PIY81006.1 MAG: hypothetical protein COY79_04325 [Candidatus Pacearchaeota archaeon CG_4_10_14_0_8_um_filter_35_169]PIZ79875.1 MAG: hypothetical protein COY00_02630 [Candidatus Pacearchaeota archaeon CG_4_10_14_0_2_um_filter
MISNHFDGMVYDDGNIQFTHSELQGVADVYGLGTIQGNPEPERGGLTNYNFRILTDNGDFNIRARKGESSAFDLRRKNIEYAVTDRLHEIGFYLDTPHFKSTSAGVRPVTLEGKTYDTYGRLPGETKKVSPVGREKVIEAIARYHEAINDLTGRDSVPVPESYDENGWLGQRLKAIRDKVQNPKTSLDGAMQANIPFVIDTYHALRTGAKPNPASVVVHGDINPGNLLYQNERLTGLIDFGNVRWGTKEGDLAKLTRGDPEQLAELVNRYRAHNDLSDQEIANILPERILGLIHGIRWLYEDMARSPEIKESMLDHHMKRLQEASKYWGE